MGRNRELRAIIEPKDAKTGYAIEVVIRLFTIPVLSLLLAAALAVSLSGCSLSQSQGADSVATGTDGRTQAEGGGAGGSTDGAFDESGNGYVRQQVSFYRGISEPRCNEVATMAQDSDRLLADNVNSVGLLPPVLITQRAGGWPRVILEGSAASVEQSLDVFHDAGLAVFVAPTTAAQGYETRVEPNETTLEHLSEDTIKWAGKAEQHQVELFSPLSKYNLALGTEAANKWSASVLSEIRKVYTGELAAKVVPDVGGTDATVRPHDLEVHDFESLDYRGYDYLMLDIFPPHAPFSQAEYSAYVAELLDRAVAVARRDGLKGVLVGEFGGWRSQVGAEELTGLALGNEGQAQAAAVVLDELMRADVLGSFYPGWTTPGRGARDFPVEQKLAEYYGSSMAITPGQPAD